MRSTVIRMLLSHLLWGRRLPLDWMQLALRLNWWPLWWLLIIIHSRLILGRLICIAEGLIGYLRLYWLLLMWILHLLHGRLPLSWKWLSLLGSIVEIVGHGIVQVVVLECLGANTSATWTDS